MSSPLRVFQPDTASAAPPFRADCATVSQVLDWYRDNNPSKSKSAMAETERLRLYGLFSTAYGNRLCSQCKPLDLLAFINQGTKPDAAWTRRRWNATIQVAFNMAAKLGLILTNPFRGLTFPEGRNGRDWSDAEYASLLRHAKPPVRRFLVMIRFSGMRPGEVKDLAWPDIKTNSRKIVLEKHKTMEKTKRPRRIPINAVMSKLLVWIRRNTPTNARHVFLNSFGRPWTTSAITKAIRAIRRRAGLPDDVHLHSGRHFFITRAIMNNVDLGAIMEIVGHQKLATTEKYLHVADKSEHLNAAMEQAVQRNKHA